MPTNVQTSLYPQFQRTHKGWFVKHSDDHVMFKVVRNNNKAVTVMTHCTVFVIWFIEFR